MTDVFTDDQIVDRALRCGSLAQAEFLPKLETFEALKRSFDRGYRHFCRVRGMRTTSIREGAHIEVMKARERRKLNFRRKLEATKTKNRKA